MLVSELLNLYRVFLDYESPFGLNVLIVDRSATWAGTWRISRHFYLDLFNHFTLILISLPFFRRQFPLFNRNSKSIRNVSASQEHFSQFTSLSNFTHIANCLVGPTLPRSVYSWPNIPDSRGKCEIYKVNATVSMEDKQNWIFARRSRRHLISLWSDSVRALPATLFHVRLLRIHSSHLIGSTWEWTTWNINKPCHFVTLQLRVVVPKTE